MRLHPLTVLAAFVALTTAFAGDVARQSADLIPAGPREEPQEARGIESDWFWYQRAFPSGSIDAQAFSRAVEQARVERTAASLGTSAGSLTWTQAGPYNIGGRVTALASTSGGTTVYLASANGGVFKSVNSGVNWTPVFDSQGVYSIGALALNPSAPATIYVGTGEANSSVDSYDGAGVFRSCDGGQSWASLGLAATARIARVAVDPADTTRIFVAAMGTQFSTGPDRGLYRSEDAGVTWSKVLFVSDSTGACDVVINPAHPETVYCATWERVRRFTYRRAYGPECGIWRSADHGTTWTRLSTGLPAPSDNVGRIALGLAASRPSTLYAQIATGASAGYLGLGLYRSLDAGQTWTRRDAGSTFVNAFGGFSWYFGDMAVDPTNPDRVFCLGVSLLRSTDGGVNFSGVTGGAHPDQHALWIDPSNVNRVYLGDDGGFYSSAVGGGTWTKSVDLPIAQFYGGAIDPQNAARLLGGTQDNNTLLTTGSPTGWIPILGGDGFQCMVDPVASNVMFAEYQFCSGGSGLQRSTSNGSSFSSPFGFDPSDRYNWNTPIVMSPRDHNVILVGSQRVYKSVDNGIDYFAVSGDLSTNPTTLITYGTITTLEISAADSATYYAGTDDGRVWRSTNSGGNWTEITAGLPLRYVTRVSADPVDPAVVYVTLSGFGSDESLAHVYRSADRGDHWTSIAGNLPDVPANDLLVDPADTQTLYLATDVGVYATRNLGLGWFPLGGGMPMQSIFDLTLHAPTRTLVAATHGRSQWKLDLTALPVAVGRAAPAVALRLSPPAPNPSRGIARLTLELPRATVVEIAIYDAFGRRVTTLAKGAYGAGRTEVAWDGTGPGGRRVRPGVYYARAAVSGAAAIRRIVRLD